MGIVVGAAFGCLVTKALLTTGTGNHSNDQHNLDNGHDKDDVEDTSTIFEPSFNRVHADTKGEEDRD